MKAYKKNFIELARRCEALSYGSFTLKSGRNSPYFFNAGKFSTGEVLAQVGRCYAECIVESDKKFDMLFGPAYKGIPLAISASIALWEDHNINAPVAYNRKEEKLHGEGGSLVGAPLAGKVLIVDDVITAGTAVRETLQIISQTDAKLAGIVVGIDREERGVGNNSAVQELEKDFNTDVLSMIGLSDLIDYLENSTNPDKKHLADLQSYRERYGILGAL